MNAVFFLALTSLPAADPGFTLVQSTSGSCNCNQANQAPRNQAPRTDAQSSPRVFAGWFGRLRDRFRKGSNDTPTQFPAAQHNDYPSHVVAHPAPFTEVFSGPNMPTVQGPAMYPQGAAQGPTISTVEPPLN